MKDCCIDITILCKVVDNFGDIGFVYRLARALEGMQTYQKFKPLSLRIVTDNLEAFSLLNPKIDAKKSFQIYKNWKIYKWEEEELCFSHFLSNPPKLILECFQCGRPDWLEKLLFEIKLSHVTNIIMIDYLTAEDYAENFHCLQSLTRSARVQKINFMPGFTSKTGGLILDNDFMKSLQDAKKVKKKDSFDILFFGYDRDWSYLIKAIKKSGIKNIKVFAAKGAGLSSFREAVFQCAFPFEFVELPFLPQQEWDAFLCKADLLFIRGEDSLSRACLSGKPFVWQAYPQSDDYQIVKVQALLTRLKAFFSDKYFKVLEKCWLSYNGDFEGNKNNVKLHNQIMEENLLEFFNSLDNLKDGFIDFAESIKKNGDLAFHLMTFIEKNYII